MNSIEKNPRVTFLKAASRNLIISAVGSVLSYLSFMLVAYMFGATAQTDVFMFASSFVLVIAALITTVLGAMFLPLYIKLLHGDDGIQRASLFANAMLFRLLVVAFIGGSLIFLFPVQLFSIVSRLDPALLRENAHILVYFALVFILTILNEYLRVLLQAREAFVPASISSVIQPAANVTCVWLLTHTLGYECLAIAAAGSRFLQFLFLLWHIRALGLGMRPSIYHNADIAEFIRVARPYWLASIVSTASVFFYDYVASGLPAGNLTAVAFAQKIYLLPISLMALPVIEVLNTRMSTLYAKNDTASLVKLYGLSIKVALLAMVPISLMIAFNSHDITSILLSRGAYSAESLTITERSLAVFGLTIPLVTLFSINGRIPLVLRNARLSSMIGSCGQIGTIGVVWLMVHYFGYIGLSAAKLLVEFVFFLPFGFYIVHHYLPNVDFSSIGKETVKTWAAALLALGVPYGMQFTALTNSGALVFVACGISGYLLAYFLVCKALRLDVVQFIAAEIGSKAKPVG